MSVYHLVAGGRDGVLVVDLGGFTQFSYDRNTQTAIVGAGWRLGPLKIALWNAGKVAIPSGVCPSVGVGGHALGGGWGFTSRKHGLMADNMLEAQVVINNGSLVVANSSQNSDLLQALKGAGANSFGIYTLPKLNAALKT
jgi:FAD/FMN-containing dehydrogenase